MQADHVSGLPELVERTGATAYLPAGRRRRVRAPRRSPTARSSSSATPRSQAIATPGPRARPSRLPRHRPHAAATSRGSCSPATRCWSATPAGPDLHAHGEHTRRGDGAHAVPLADRAAADAARPPRCSTRRTTRARSAAAACRPTRSRRSASSAATTTRCSFDSEDAFVAALLERHPAGARAAGRDRRRQPRRPAARRARVTARAGRARAAREPRAVLAARRGQRVRRRDGRPRALDAAAHRPRATSASPRAPRCCRSSSPSGSPRRSPTSAPARSPQRLGRRRLLIAGWAIALPVPLLIARRAELGLDRRRQRPARRQPGPRLVDDRRDEDRPRRARSAAASRSASTRPPATAASRSPPRLSGWLAAEFAARDVLVVGGAVDRASSRSSCRSLFVRDTAAHVALEQARRPRRRATRAAAAARRVRRRDATATRRCAPARRPASSTTSTTRSPGASSRSSSPPTARASARSASSPGSTRRVWGVGADRDRPLVRPRRAQAADRRRHARSRPPRSALLAASGGAVGARRASPRSLLGARHRARLPDADRRDLRRRRAGRARAGRRRLPLLARHGLRRRRR